LKTLLSEFRSAALVTLILAVVCCGLYPLVVFALGQACFPARANGSLILDAHGTVRGSRLIGQDFTSDRYFHSRPSDAGNGYDAANSGGSNLGPTSRKLYDNIAEGVAEYRAQNGLASNAPVPADAVTASASGLDPEISPANAELQAPRVARARGLALDRVRALIARYTLHPDLGVLGDPGVNVLELNLALDKARSASTGRSGAQAGR
jgi:potassium-transporting ATPase KdpC subunit